MTAKISRREALLLLGAAAAALYVWGKSSTMLTKAIPSSKEALPVIGMGTWQTFDAGSSAAARAPLEEVLSLFVSLGGRLVDSSPMYGSSEDVVGDLAVKLGLREKLFMATKVWTSGRGAG